MRAKHFMFLLLAVLLIAPTLLWSQPPPGRMGGKGGFDPDQMFNRLSGGADVIKISALTDPRQQFMAKKMAERAGVTGDQMTRDQYKAGLQNSDMMLGGKGLPGAPPMFKQGGDGRLDAEALNFFAQMDANHDGFITRDEAQRSQKLKDPAVFATFDMDKDEKLSFDEYKAFYSVTRAGQQDAKPTEALEDERPTIYRVGKLPKELPPWFAEIDKKGDNDGQVGMDEWAKYSNKNIDEFLSMDLNNDGVLTAEEYLKFHKHQEEVAKNDPLAAASQAGAIPGVIPGGGGGMGRPGGGRPGGGGGGGGWPGGGGMGRPGGGGDANPGDNPRQGRGGRGNRGQRQ